MHDLFLVQPARDRTYGTVSVSMGSRACVGSTTGTDSTDRRTPDQSNPVYLTNSDHD